VLAIVLLIGAMILPRMSHLIVSYTLDSAARRYLIDAQAIRQRAVVTGRVLRIEYISSVPALIRVLDGTTELTEFSRTLPQGLTLEPLTHSTKWVQFDPRGEATWESGAPTYTIIIRASNNQRMELIFHRAGRIMLLVVP